MDQKLSDKVAYHWLDTVRSLPTRSLQLSFEVASSKYDQLTDFSIVMAVLRNNPSIVPDELISQISKISDYIKGERAEIRGKRAEKRKNHIRYRYRSRPFNY